MTRFVSGKDESCRQCGHAFDPHALVPTSEDETEGGIILCPVMHCQCFATWALPGHEPREVYIPDVATINKIRRIIQIG